MKTLLLSPELFYAEGGIARIMRLYLKALCENADPGDEVAAIALNDGPGPDPRLAQYSTPALRGVTGCRRRKARFVLEAIWQAARADRVVCGHLHLLPVARLMQRLQPGIRYSLVAHGIEVWRPYTLLETRALRGAHRILCVSEYTRRQLLRFCPTLDPLRLVCLPNALDPCFEETGGNGAPANSTAHPRILTVSRLSTGDRYKGIDTLIEALPLVRRQYPQAKLRIVGSGGDLPRLQALAEQMAVTPAVDFTGQLTDEALHAEYRACDLFALPSRKEGFGLVYLEAMTAGKACVAARAGAAPEIIGDPVGALAEYGNIPEIAAAVIDVVRFPRDPAAIRRHAEGYSFGQFKPRLAAALA